MHKFTRLRDQFGRGTVGSNYSDKRGGLTYREKSVIACYTHLGGVPPFCITYSSGMMASLESKHAPYGRPTHTDSYSTSPSLKDTDINSGKYVLDPLPLGPRANGCREDLKAVLSSLPLSNN